jgi:Histone acetyltransferase subunit NuA4
VTLPLFLRKKWNDQEGELDEEVNSSNNDKTKKTVLPLHPQPQQRETDAVFTADDLEQRIHAASVNMIEIQKQLYRGEEMYHEETNSHGNVFIRWDAFIDIRDLSGSSNTQGTGSRRMPADNRWFSGSCKSVIRSSRTYPIFAKGITAPPTPIPRSQTSTPLLPLPPTPKVVPALIPAPSSIVSSSLNPSPRAATAPPVASPAVIVPPPAVCAPPVSPPAAIPVPLPKAVPPPTVVPTKPDATATPKPAITQAPVAAAPIVKSNPGVPTTTETPLRRNRKRKVVDT